LSNSKTHVAHSDIISLMIRAHDSPYGSTAATWIIQISHRFCYQSKANMRLPISD